MREIFNPCLGGVIDQMLCQKRPLQILAIFCRPFNLQAEKNADSFKRSDKVRCYEFTINHDSLILSTEGHVVKEGNNVIDGIVSNSKN